MRILNENPIHDWMISENKNEGDEPEVDITLCQTTVLFAFKCGCKIAINSLPTFLPCEKHYQRAHTEMVEKGYLHTSLS